MKNAVETFADIVTSISQYWETRLEQAETNTNEQDNLVAALSYSFHSRVSHRVDDMLESLTLTRLDASPGPNNAWPKVYVQDLEGSYVALEADAKADQVIYTVPSDIDIPATTWPIFKLIWDELNVAEVQNARAKMCGRKKSKFN